MQDDPTLLVQLILDELCRGVKREEARYMFVLRKCLAASQINNEDTQKDVVVPRCEWVT